MSVTAVQPAVHPYIASLALGGSALPRSPATWLNERRAQALERANALSVPTIRDEEWRFTDLAPLTRLKFEPAATAAAILHTDIEPHVLPEAAARLVFVDGVYAPSLSQLLPATSGIHVGTLAEGLKALPAVVEPYLARLAVFEKQVFTALNTAWLRDGAMIVLERGKVLDAPLHVLFVATQKDVVTYPRCLLVAQNGAACTLVEDYVSLARDAYFTNAVTEIAVAANARVRHVRVQRESAAAFHIDHCAVSLAKDAVYNSQSVAMGAKLSRCNLDITQRGEGAEAVIDGLALIAGDQHADTHTFMDHALPHGRCAQLHKTIVGGAAHAVFNGKVFVRKGAQLTNSAQQSRNLLLSPRARVDTKPQLEIFADDVKCAHGATVGQLDDEHLFYLKSRGLSEGAARDLLIYAFGAEVIERIPVKSLAEKLERVMTTASQTTG
jgi:Fe-S cluster assembly protein SufD